MLDRPALSRPLVADIPLGVGPDLSTSSWPADPSVRRGGAIRGVIRAGALRHGATVAGHGAAEIFAVLADGAPLIVEATWQRLHNAVREIAASPAGRIDDLAAPRQED